MPHTGIHMDLYAAAGVTCLGSHGKGELDSEAVYIVNPRTFTIDAINYLGKNCNLVLMGNSKNRNLDYIAIYNQLVSPTNPIDTNIYYITEFDYVFNSFER